VIALALANKFTAVCLEYFLQVSGISRPHNAKT
jgi:hypothetical protein